MIKLDPETLKRILESVPQNPGVRGLPVGVTKYPMAPAPTAPAVPARENLLKTASQAGVNKFLANIASQDQRSKYFERHPDRKPTLKNIMPYKKEKA